MNLSLLSIRSLFRPLRLGSGQAFHSLLLRGFVSFLVLGLLGALALASCTSISLIVIVSVFLILVGVWCAIAYGLTSVPTIATILTSQGSIFVPCVLISLGIFIVKESISLAFLALAISYLWAIAGRGQELAKK